MNTILQLTVQNHPGVLSHVSSLFARKAFNLNSICCMPIGDGTRSQIWLRVQEGQRIEQLVKQLEKLIDVEEVRLHGAEHPVYQNLEKFFSEIAS